MKRILAVIGLPVCIALIGMGLACSNRSPEPNGSEATQSTPGAVGTPSAPKAEVGTGVGNTVRHFDFKLIDGSTQSTARLAGQDKPVFLFFFTTW